MSYAIFRCQGIKTLSDLAKIGKHNKREKRQYKSNPDIRIADSINNIELIKCDKSYIKKFYEIVKDYQKEYEEKMKTIRPDRYKSFYEKVNDSKSVVADEMIFTSDKKFFDVLTKDEIMTWANESLKFVYEDLGYTKEQIVHATLHLDERAPHIHLVAVPLIKKFDKRAKKEVYSISKKHYINSNLHLCQLQDKYYERLTKCGFELQRGEKNTGIKHLTMGQLKNVTRIFDKKLDNIKWEMNQVYRQLLKDMQNSVKKSFNNKYVLDFTTYQRFLDYLKKAYQAIKDMSPSEGLYKELEKEIGYYKKLLLIKDENDKQFDLLNLKIEDLTKENSSLLNFIINLLQALKDIFRNTLLFGKDKEKDLVISQVKDCYNKNLYNDKDIHYITKDTSKEKEMDLYLEEKDYDI